METTLIALIMVRGAKRAEREGRCEKRRAEAHNSWIDKLRGTKRAYQRQLSAEGGLQVLKGGSGYKGTAVTKKRPAKDERKIKRTIAAPRGKQKNKGLDCRAGSRPLGVSRKGSVLKSEIRFKQRQGNLASGMAFHSYRYEVKAGLAEKNLQEGWPAKSERRKN